MTVFSAYVTKQQSDDLSSTAIAFNDSYKVFLHCSLKSRVGNSFS